VVSSKQVPAEAPKLRANPNGPPKSSAARNNSNNSRHPTKPREKKQPARAQKLTLTAKKMLSPNNNANNPAVAKVAAVAAEEVRIATTNQPAVMRAYLEDAVSANEPRSKEVAVAMLSKTSPKAAKQSVRLVSSYRIPQVKPLVKLVRLLVKSATLLGKRSVVSQEGRLAARKRVRVNSCAFDWS
jgi:hypothetical protein